MYITKYQLILVRSGNTSRSKYHDKNKVAKMPCVTNKNKFCAHCLTHFHAFNLHTEVQSTNQRSTPVTIRDWCLTIWCPLFLEGPQQTAIIKIISMFACLCVVSYFSFTHSFVGIVDVASKLTDEWDAFLVDDATGQQMEIELNAIHDDRVAGIVTALQMNNIGNCVQQIYAPFC